MPEGTVHPTEGTVHPPDRTGELREHSVGLPASVGNEGIRTFLNCALPASNSFIYFERAAEGGRSPGALDPYAQH
jgi:hypothetical protein